ncbi:MAG: hypothetical protein KA007_00285 [Candidatus Pacebacteria bacterium]|jgi:hypothetical protein|nr:hypothetical protein [Candidatus Paceibacterota bacterium]
MKTKTVTVNVQIQMDINKDENEVTQVQNVLEAMNSAVSSASIHADPQIFISDISGADIFDVPNDDEE